MSAGGAHSIVKRGFEGVFGAAFLRRMIGLS
jgi:hypothetical protein